MRRHTTTLIAALTALALTACSCQHSPAPKSLSTFKAAITLDYEAVVAFHADWNEVTEVGPVRAGGRLKLRYAPERLPNCRAHRYGMPAWSILAYWSAEGHDPTYVPLRNNGAMLEAEIDVPEDVSELSVWFYANDYYGCREYDSNLNENYVFAVTPPAQAAEVVFGPEWVESRSEPIQRGGLMRVLYAPERLQACRQKVNGLRAWNIYASWRFEPGGETDTVALIVDRPQTGSHKVLTPEVVVPEDATSVALWFSNSDSSGCTAWDSDYGSNYTFDVEAEQIEAPRAGWIGDFNWVLYYNEPDHRGDVDPVWYWDHWQGVPVGASVDLQVWIPGVTDLAYGSTDEARAAAEAHVKAEAVTDAIHNGGTWGSYELSFSHQHGNNFVYQFWYPELRWQIYGYEIPDGLYRWYARFSTDGGGTWVRSDGERRFAVAAQEDCTLFGDGGPPSCPKDATVGWVGDWGQYQSHQCRHVSGVEEPKVYTKSAAGHDCMSITADVWVEGLTDAGGSPSAITAQVETDMMWYSGPTDTPVTHDLSFDHAVGNNYRYRWHAGPLVSSVERGDYKFRFRFSADGGETWTYAGLDGDGWRHLQVRNDSQDVGQPPVESCEGIELWEGPTQHIPYCLDYVQAGDYDASHCELWVNAFGRGSWSHSGTSAEWLEAWVRVAPVQQGTVEAVGMWISYVDGAGETKDLFSIGSEVEPDYWKTGLTTSHTGMGAPGISLSATKLAVFLDVRRPEGQVERLWQSAGGANYTVEEIFAVEGYVNGIGSGSVEYADESVGLFDQKKTCGQ